MERGAKELLSRLESKSLDTSHPVPLFLNMADAVSASMGGTSGVLIELMLRTMSTFLNSSDAVDVDAKVQPSLSRSLRRAHQAKTKTKNETKQKTNKNPETC
jgi:hypothetical protein